MNEFDDNLKQELDAIQVSMNRFHDILKEYPEIKQFTLSDRLEIENYSFEVWNACNDLKAYLHLIGKINKARKY